MKLSSTLSLLVFSLLILVIGSMSMAFYYVSKNFYKDQIRTEIETRLQAHRDVIELEPHEMTFDHVVMMEQREQVSQFLVFDSDFQVIRGSILVDETMIEHYVYWMKTQMDKSLEQTAFIETMEEHIPHVWSYTPIMIEGNVAAYLFIDRDTGDFERARSQLLKITMFMGFLTLVISFIFTVFLSKKITAPLINAGKVATKIAQGDYQIDFKQQGSNEISNLMTELSSMAEQLETLKVNQQQFLSDVSHDLRTPLTYIKAYSALLKDHRDKVVQEQSTIIYDEANRMERLVQDLFQLKKLEEGQMPIQKETVHIGEWLERTISKLTVTAGKKGVQIITELDKTTITSEIDPDRMEQAILNLMMNAIRHTSKGDTICVVLEKDRENDFRIKIIDSGEGIPEEDLPHIWDRFYRVDKSRSTQFGGSGLGLAITKQIIKQHGLQISVTSQLGKGTTFTIFSQR